jgi:hypothetical protein
MKMSMNAQLVLSLGLFTIGAADAVWAAESIGDSQEQARLLLSGTSFPSADPKPHSAISNSNPSDLVAASAQEQARQMILGGQAAGAGAHRSRAAAAAAGDHEVYGDALESARRMILGAPSKANSALPLLASKPSK